jgi:hypothetical protein
MTKNVKALLKLRELDRKVTPAVTRGRYNCA